MNLAMDSVKLSPGNAGQDFRDQLSTADREGRRRWLFPKQPAGRYYRIRMAVSWLLIGLMFAGPFVTIQGNPLLMFNIVERKFSILGRIFWPQDIPIFAVAMLIFFTGIIVFTAAFGRLWCGWTCPQTVMMEMVFRRIEYLIEGDHLHQQALARAPWDVRKSLKKGLKHTIFLLLSFLIGNTLLSYIIGVDALYRIVSDNPLNHLQGLGCMVLFTLGFYALFARFREQACTFICPYGRFQSTLVDENTILVAYDHKRGERRGRPHGRESQEVRRSRGTGDCIDCRQCVVVCPTGIDIRNGTQMECVNCTACIDACDAVMDKIGRPLGLIRYASLNGIEQGERLRVTPRLAGYASLLGALIVLFLVLVLTRSEVQPTFLRAPGTLFQELPGGRISNLYTLKLINKTSRDMEVRLRLEETPGEIRVLGSNLHIPGGKFVQASVLVELDRKLLLSGKAPIVVGFYAGNRCLERVKSTFIGPRE